MTFQTRRIREDKPRKHFPWAKAATFCVAIAGPLMRFVRWEEKKITEKKEKEKQHTKRALLLRRTFVIVISVFLAFVLFAGVAEALISLKIVSLQTFLNVAGKDLPVDENGFTNFLLLGKGDDDHDGIDLTDTMMVASIDPSKTKSAVLLSIPRDLFVTDSKVMGKGRINQLYRDYKETVRRQNGISRDAAGEIALRELMDELGRKLHMQIHHAVIVNFTGFEKVVDAIGGIDVVVPYDIVDREYPGPDYSYETFEIHAGPAHLDGETALKYVRSRHTTSDFGRSARQQQVMKAIAEKAETLGIMGSPGKISSLYGILSENVQSTMSLSEILGAAKIAEKIDRTKIINMQLNDQNGLFTSLAAPGGFLYSPPRDQFGGASVLLPVSMPTAPTTWKQISLFTNLLTTQRAIYLSHPEISILNAGGKPGMAGRLSAELTRFGFDVRRAENADLPKEMVKKPTQDLTMIIARDPTLDTDTTAFFASLLHLPVQPVATLPLPPEQLGNVTIVLGKNYTYTPLQDLLPALQ